MVLSLVNRFGAALERNLNDRSDSTQLSSAQLDSFQFDSIWFDLIWFRSIQFGPIRFNCEPFNGIVTFQFKLATNRPTYLWLFSSRQYLSLLQSESFLPLLCGTPTATKASAVRRSLQVEVGSFETQLGTNRFHSIWEAKIFIFQPVSMQQQQLAITWTDNSRCSPATTCCQLDHPGWQVKWSRELENSC